VRTVSSKLHLPAGSSAGEEYDLEVTPESAGWGYSSLRVLTLPANGTHTFDTGPDEIVVVPLSGSATVEVDRAFLELEGRPHVFAGPTDFAYLPVRSHATLSSDDGRGPDRAGNAVPLRTGAAGAGRAARCRPVQPAGP
jgi:5-deoxy-glucuronate isomerase